MRKIKEFFCFLVISAATFPLCVDGAPSKKLGGSPDETKSNPDDSGSFQYPEEVKVAMLESLRASQEWLKLIDEGRYEESWDRGAPLFQKTIGKEEWVLALDKSRKHLGPVSSRMLKSQLPAQNPKGMPQGAYMVIEYKSSFARKTNSSEIVTLGRDSDGQWKVLSYLVN